MVESKTIRMAKLTNWPESPVTSRITRTQISMDLSEATRLYQATLTACRSSEDAGTDEEFMVEELKAAKHAMNTAWLEHTTA
jgi:hypothetical protein